MSIKEFRFKLLYGSSYGVGLFEDIDAVASLLNHLFDARQVAFYVGDAVDRIFFGFVEHDLIRNYCCLTHTPPVGVLKRGYADIAAVSNRVHDFENVDRRRQRN